MYIKTITDLNNFYEKYGKKDEYRGDTVFNWNQISKEYDGIHCENYHEVKHMTFYSTNE